MMCQGDNISTWDKDLECYPRPSPKWVIKFYCKNFNEALKLQKKIYNATMILGTMNSIKQNKYL